MPNVLSAFEEERKKRLQQNTPFLTGYQPTGTGGPNDTMWNRLANGTIGSMVQGALSGFTNPHDAYAGTLPAEDYADAGMQTAGLAMGGGLATAPAQDAMGMTLNSGLPRLREMYHSTGAQVPFDRLKAPPKNVDLGIHMTDSPGIATTYQKRSRDRIDDSIPYDKWEGIRTYPVLADVRNPLITTNKPIGDPIWWNKTDALEVMEPLKYSENQKMRRVYNQLYEIAKVDDTNQWNDNFADIVKNNGFDGLYYRHGDPYMEEMANPKWSDFTNWEQVPFKAKALRRNNALMVFDEDRVIPKFSAEGDSLAAQRGVKPARKMDLRKANADEFDFHIEDMLEKEQKHADRHRKLQEIYGLGQ